MRTRRLMAIGAMVVLATASGAGPGEAQTPEELRQQLRELERSTREQLEELRRQIEQREAEQLKRLESEQERERRLQILQEEIERQRRALDRQEERVAGFLDGWRNFFDLQAGAKQSNNDPQPLGRDIRGNVYASDQFKIRLGGSLRLHSQYNDTPVGESVSRALLPDPDVPGGGNATDRENFRAFAGRSRLNLSVDGPVTLGGRTQGFFEMDFNRQFSSGEGGAVNPNPRLRHAFGRWRFDDLVVNGDELVLTIGQTTSFADNVPDTVDFNTMLAGLGAALRRNPRAELLHRYPLSPQMKFVSALGVERPFFGADFIATDLGPGDLSGFPALSGGVGLETGRLGESFGVGSARIYLRTTWGEFEERFVNGVPNLGAQTNFSERHFTNQTAWATFTLDRIGFNRTGRARTLQLRGGALWTRGEAFHLNAEFDRRLIRDSDGSLTEAQSVGGFINPMFWITDTVSVRWAGGWQSALDTGRPVVTGNLAAGSFFRTQNRQSEVSVWWTPGPFTFALAWNYTKTDYRQVFPGGGSRVLDNENNKIELISWFSF